MSIPPVDAAAFRAALGQFATGITVITARDEAGLDQGMTVSAFCALSLTPPLVLVCIGHDATLAPTLAGASHFGVSVLGESQAALSRRFADAAAVRFDGVEHQRGVTGAALLSGAVAQLECRIAAKFPGGDHTIVVGEVIAAAAAGGAPLLHYQSTYHRLAE